MDNVNFESENVNCGRNSTFMDKVSSELDSQESIRTFYKEPVVNDIYFVSCQDMDKLLEGLDVSVEDICNLTGINYLNFKDYPNFSDYMFAVYHHLGNRTVTCNRKVFGRGYFFTKRAIAFILQYWEITVHSQGNIRQVKGGIWLNDDFVHGFFRTFQYFPEENEYLLLFEDYYLDDEQSYSADSFMGVINRFGEDYPGFMEIEGFVDFLSSFLTVF